MCWGERPHRCSSEAVATYIASQVSDGNLLKNRCFFMGLLYSRSRSQISTI